MTPQENIKKLQNMGYSTGLLTWFLQVKILKRKLEEEKDVSWFIILVSAFVCFHKFLCYRVKIIMYYKCCLLNCKEIKTYSTISTFQQIKFPPYFWISFSTYSNLVPYIDLSTALIFSIGFPQIDGNKKVLILI